MSNARDDKDRVHQNKKRRDARSTFAPSEEIGEMHYSTENYSTAIEYFEGALSSPDLQDFPDRYRLLLRVGDCHRNKGDYRKSQELIEEARVLLPDPPPGPALGQIEYREAFNLYIQSNYDEALKLCYSAYRRLKHSKEHKEVADVQLLLANCYQRIGLSGEAEDFFMDALSSYRRIDDRVGIAYVYNNLGILHKNACRWNRALAALSKSMDLAKSLGLTQHLIRVQLNLGIVYAKLRRFSDALSAFTNAGNMAERVGDQFKLTHTLGMRGRTYVQTREFCKAEKHILRAQTLANEYGYVRESALYDEYLAELMIARGKYDAALTNLERAHEKASQIAPEGDLMAEVLRRMADVYYETGRIDEALAVIERGVEVAENCGEFYELGYFYRTRGRCLRRSRDMDDAATAYRRSIGEFSKYGNTFEKHVSQRMLARLLLTVGNRESLLRAKQVLSDSIVGFGKIEEGREQMRSQFLLAIVEDRLGNFDEALLSLYEADRIAEEEHEERCQALVRAYRTRIETKMRRDTRMVLEQIPMIGNLHVGSRSRDKLVSGLGGSLKMIMSKLNAKAGFIAVPRAGGGGFEVVRRENIKPREAASILAWHAELPDDRKGKHGMAIVEAPMEKGFADRVKHPEEFGTLVFQELGFENQSLGVIFVHQNRDPQGTPIGQDALHFLGTCARLISLSVYEMVRNEKWREPKAKPAGSGFERIVTENHDMIKLLNLAERVASSNATVLLQGETGTGKGLIAYAVHLLSNRRERRFVHVNCAAMPESLLESELFGHMKGAFTGASADKDGLLHQADGGTVFLDEIGKTSLTMQGKLLQFLDTGKVRRVGSNELVPVDVRVICASKSDLMGMCEEGRFLEDFFYRINDFPLTVPPLRRRREDIELLFFHYLRKFSGEMDKSIVSISDEAMDALRNHHWAGNVRELEKTVKRAVILADDGDVIDIRHLPAELMSPKANGGASKAGRLRDKIDRLERSEILGALERHRWNKSQAAIDLGISYPSLLSKIKRYNIRTY